MIRALYRTTKDAANMNAETNQGRRMKINVRTEVISHEAPQKGPHTQVLKIY